jgi:hypothetical protein
MNSQENEIVDTYIVMWDMYGLESLINVSEGEREAIIQALKGEQVNWRNPLQFMILRARFNSQRCYEIYSFSSSMTYKEIVEIFSSSPQVAADTIRNIGNKIYSDRQSKSQVIT